MRRMPPEPTRPRPGPRLARALTLALSLAGLCVGRDGASQLARVLHLAPRLEDGRSPTAGLTAGPPPLESRFAPEEQSRWSMTVDPELTELVLAGPIDADAYGHLQLLLEVRGQVRYELAWTRAGEPAGGRR